MNIDEIVWSDMGVEKNEATVILDEIKRLMDEEPEKRLDIHNISESAQVTYHPTRMVLFTLLALHEVVTTFIPICVNCGEAMGSAKRTVYEIENREYICPDCGDSEVEIGLLFWKPGSTKGFNDA